MLLRRRRSRRLLPIDRYKTIPPVSRAYFTTAFLTTAACAVDIVSPLTLYFNYDLVFTQPWRLITSFLFFGTFSVDFLFHMYFLVQYSRLLEEGDFRGRTSKFLWLLLFGVVWIATLASAVGNVHFLGNALTFMMTYVWGRRNPDVRMAFLGVLTFQAPYFPWVMLTFSALLGQSITMDVIGIVVGHAYYFFEYVYPVMAELRGWPVRRLLEPPTVLQWVLGEQQRGAGVVV